MMEFFGIRTTRIRLLVDDEARKRVQACTLGVGQRRLDQANIGSIV